MANFFKYVAVFVAISSASAIKNLMPHMYLEGYLANSFSLSIDETSHLLNLNPDDQSCYLFDGLEVDENAKQNKTIRQCSAGNKTNRWTAEQNIPTLISKDNLMMRASIPDTSIYKPVKGLNCETETTCNNVEYYPTNLAKKLLQEGNHTFMMEYYNTEVNLKTMCNNRFDEIDIIPKAGRIGDKWYYIVNYEGGPQQGLKSVTLCGSQKKCESVHDLLEHYVKCEQKTEIRPFVVIDDTESLAVKMFNVSTHCECNTLVNNSTPLPRH